jgi:hypothetical protein
MGFLKHLIKDLSKEANYRKHHHYENHDYNQHYPGSDGIGYPSSSGIFLSIKNLIRRNRKIVYFFLGVVGLFLLLIIGLIVALLPMILAGLSFLYDNGIKGVIDILLGLFKMLWEGSGK